MSVNHSRFARALRTKRIKRSGATGQKPLQVPVARPKSSRQLKKIDSRRFYKPEKHKPSLKRKASTRRDSFRFIDRFSSKYQLAFIKCPACHSSILKKRQSYIDCMGCGKSYEVINGMPNLAPDLSITTKLEHIDYNSIHSIGDQVRDAVFGKWEKVLNRIDAKGGKVLEIGSGTGQLTDGLLNRYNFHSVHATDISATFLQQTEREYVRETSNKAYFYLCDANELPFRENTFDVVLGHSVLHHFLNYNQTLKACSRVLKPGGKAVFFEPVIQGKIMVAMLLQMIIEIQQHSVQIFTDEEVLKIKRIIHHITKARFIGDDKEKLAKMEDKYIFDPIRLRGSLHEYGFSNIRIEKVGMLHKNYRLYVAENLRIAGVDPNKLKYFQYLFQSFGNTTGALLNNSTLFPPMVFLVFEK